MTLDYCAEIRGKLLNSPTKFRFSSGYAIGSDLILTCWHGLNHQSVDKNAKIQITWRNKQGESLDPLEISFMDICWENKELDVAVLRCSCPHWKEEISVNQIFSSHQTQNEQKWHSRGFIAKLKDVDGQKELLSPSGIIKETFSNSFYMKLWCETDYVENAELWGGFSGSPVFIADKIIGVIKASNKGKNGRHLIAVSSVALLQANDDKGSGSFKKVIGWIESDKRKNRQDRQFEKICKAIDGQIEVFKAFNDQFNIILNTKLSLSEPNAIVKKFNELNDEQAVKCITAIFKVFCKLRKEVQALSIGTFIEAWWPVLFEHDSKLELFREQLNQNDCAVVDCPTGLATTTELMMAEAEERMIKLELTARNILGSPNDLGSFAETGLNEDGSEEQRQLDELLSTRFLSAEHMFIFERFIDTVVNIVGSHEDTLDVLKRSHDKEEHQAKLTKILKDQVDTYGFHFYFRFDVDKNFECEMIEPIKQRYPSLAFLISICNDSQEESERYLSLMQIVTATKSKDNLLREFDKYA